MPRKRSYASTISSVYTETRPSVSLLSYFVPSRRLLNLPGLQCFPLQREEPQQLLKAVEKIKEVDKWKTLILCPVNAKRTDVNTSSLALLSSCTCKAPFACQDL